MQKKDTAQIRAILRDYFASADFARAGHDVVSVYLFGSVARGNAAYDDVDVAVLLRHDPPLTLEGLCLDLGAELEKRLGSPVDLIVLNTAPVDLIHRVLRDGMLLLDRDPSRRIRFEVRARSEFFDVQPILERYRRSGRAQP